MTTLALGIIIGILLSLIAMLARKENREAVVTKVKNITGNNQAEII